jgi:hypothetical protein
MSWLELCRHGDSEEHVREVVLAEFADRWLRISASIREQVVSQGATLESALQLVEQLRGHFEQEALDLVPGIMDRLAASASRLH